MKSISPAATADKSTYQSPRRLRVRRFGVCPGKNTRVIQNEKQPGYGHIKMGGYAQDEKHKPGSYG